MDVLILDINHIIISDMHVCRTNGALYCTSPRSIKLGNKIFYTLLNTVSVEFCSSFDIPYGITCFYIDCGFGLFILERTYCCHRIIYLKNYRASIYEILRKVTDSQYNMTTSLHSLQTFTVKWYNNIAFVSC